MGREMAGKRERGKRTVTVTPIGIIHSPYKITEGMPIQPSRSAAMGKIEVFDKYAKGLKDIEGFSHIIILYLFHKSKKTSLLVAPFLDKKQHGIFAMRHPDRPNKIGFSVLKLLKRHGNILKVKGIDVLDGTPLLDIKPYVELFDSRKNTRSGWLEGKLEG